MITGRNKKIKQRYPENYFDSMIVAYAYIINDVNHISSIFTLAKKNPKRMQTTINKQIFRLLSVNY